MSEVKKVTDEELEIVNGGTFIRDGIECVITKNTKFWSNSDHTMYFVAKENKSFTVNSFGNVKCELITCRDGNPNDIYTSHGQVNATFNKIIDCISKYGLIK